MITTIENSPYFMENDFKTNDKDSYKHLYLYNRDLDSYNQDINECTNELLSEYKYENKIRKIEDEDKYRIVFKSIILNCIKSIMLGKKHILISLNNSSFSIPKRYQTITVGYKIYRNVIIWLAVNDYINLYKANPSSYKNKSSEVDVGQYFSDLIETYSIKFNDIIEHYNTEKIILKNETQLLDYEDNIETIRRRNILNQYIEMLTELEIKIDGEQLKEFSLKSKFKHNIQSGGRIYGGQWMNCQKDLRVSITINSNKTVEYDLSNCMIRLAANLSKITLPITTDLYLIEDFDRELIKKIAVVMLTIKPNKSLKQSISNCTNTVFYDISNNAIRKLIRFNSKLKPQVLFSDIQKNSYSQEQLNQYGITTTKAVIREAVEKTYNSYKLFLSDWLFKGRGMELQYVESKITFSVIEKCLAQDVPVLTIHDGYMTDVKNEHKLFKIINNAYSELINGHLPKILKQ